MIYITIGVIIILLIVAITVLALSDAISEFPSFMYIILGVVIFIIGAAIYLGFAVPSFADSNSFGIWNNEKAKTVTQDSMEGLPLVEE